MNMFLNSELFDMA